MRAAIASALRITIGTIGTPADMARRNGPFLNGPTDRVSSRVPSGAITTDSPLRVSSSASRSDSIAACGLSRSMNTVSTRRPSVPTTGSFCNSFLPTAVQLSWTSDATMTPSKLLRWLNRNTAGRFLLRFSRPSTLTRTPLAASSICGNAVVKKLTPRRLLPVSTPQPIAPESAGTSDPAASRVRT